jgi:hypothetical protein
MTLDEMKTELEKIGKTDLMEGIAELISQERNRGIDEVSKRNKEAQNLRKYKLALEAAGLNEGDDLTEFLSKKTTTKDDSISLKSLKAELDRVKAERDNERLSGKKKTLEAELTNAFGDKVYGSKYLIKDLIANGSVDQIDGEIVFKSGDEHISFAEGIQKVLDNNKDMLRTNQTAGSKTTKSDVKVGSLDSIMRSGNTDSIKANFNDIAKELGLKI